MNTTDNPNDSTRIQQNRADAKAAFSQMEPDRVEQRPARATSTATYSDDRSPDEIEHDIQRTRSQMDETLTALQRKLSPDRITDGVIDYIRHGGASEFVDNFSESVKRNPVPVALVGIGLAWLMMSGREGRYAPQNARVHSGSGGAQLGEKLSGAASRVAGAASSARDSLSGAAQRVTGAASGAAHRVSGAASGAAQRVSGAASASRQRLSSGRGRMSSAGSQMRERGAQVRGRASEFSGQAREQAGRAYESMREQPLLMGALGIAIGAAIGAMLPPTRREDELMGEARDRVASRTREQVTEQLDKGKKIAQRAGEAASEAAKDEAKRQTGSEGSSSAGARPSSRM